MSTILRGGNCGGDKAITSEQERNLRVLAHYLAELPHDYKHFNMEQYMTGGEPEAQPLPVNACGTAACAVGHGPNAGIAPELNEMWTSYAERAFGAQIDHDHGIFDWCFGSEWTDVDNTPLGAAQRITLMLDNGHIPEDGNEMRHGLTAPDYEDVVVPKP